MKTLNYIICLIAAVMIMACAQTPVDFETYDTKKDEAPVGCKDGRTRGVDC